MKGERKTIEDIARLAATIAEVATQMSRELNTISAPYRESPSEEKRNLVRSAHCITGRFVLMPPSGTSVYFLEVTEEGEYEVMHQRWNVEDPRLVKLLALGLLFESSDDVLLEKHKQLTLLRYQQQVLLSNKGLKGSKLYYPTLDKNGNLAIAHVAVATHTPKLVWYSLIDLKHTMLKHKADVKDLLRWGLI